jgi:hypothetical protein
MVSGAGALVAGPFCQLFPHALQCRLKQSRIKHAQQKAAIGLAPTSAVDLKFLPQLRRGPCRNFKAKTAPES